MVTLPTLPTEIKLTGHWPVLTPRCGLGSATHRFSRHTGYGIRDTGHMGHRDDAAHGARREFQSRLVGPLIRSLSVGVRDGRSKSETGSAIDDNLFHTMAVSVTILRYPVRGNASPGGEWKYRRRGAGRRMGGQGGSPDVARSRH